MTGLKGILASKTIWGAAITVASVIFDVGQGEQQLIHDSLLQVSQAGGALLSVYGRLTANSKLSGLL